MEVYNFGSINIDEVYKVKDIVKAGETISSFGVFATLGGKGLNQSIALAKAKANISHVGIINNKDEDILKFLEKENINKENVLLSDTETGKAIIQLSEAGENSIVLNPGSNYSFGKKFIDKVLESIEHKSLILTQNETNNVDYVLKKAKQLGHITALNMAPYNQYSNLIDLNDVDYLIINEHEGEMLTNTKNYEEILDTLINMYPSIKVVLTLGSKGVKYKSELEYYSVDALKVNVVDTTGAGDTFVGYFLASLSQKNILTSLQYANAASSLAIQTLGASDSIPQLSDVERVFNENYTEL